MSLGIAVSTWIDMHTWLESDMIEPSSLFASVGGLVSPSGPIVTDASEMVVSGGQRARKREGEAGLVFDNRRRSRLVIRAGHVAKQVTLRRRGRGVV